MTAKDASHTKDEIIVLHSVKFGDSSIIVSALTGDRGREGLMLRGIGKSRQRSLLAHLHPLSILEVEINPSRKGTLSYLTDFRPKHQLHSLRSNIIKSNIALFICETVNKTVTESQKDTRLYEFLRDSILLLDSLEESYSNYHLIFIVRLASLIGFHPEDNYSSINNLFDIEKAMFVPRGYKSDNSMQEEESEILHLILSNSTEDSLKIKLSGERRFSFIVGFIKYLEHHLDYRLNLKSHIVLNEIMRET